MRNNKSKLEGKKEKILELGEKGYTYKQIKNAIGCSLGTISYHLGDGQKEKYLNRLRKNKPSSRERKEEYVYSQKANKPCSVCKGVFDAAAMDFHHKDRKTKFHSISRMMAARYSIKKIQAEIEKCILVCACCHRIIESKINNDFYYKKRVVNE